MKHKGFEIFWEGHATVRVKDEDFSVIVDPNSKVDTDFNANIVLVTHHDSGHFDQEAIDKVIAEGGCVIAPDSFNEEDIPCKDVELIGEEESIEVFGVVIESTPMYNKYHERGCGIGFIFDMQGVNFYVAGDTGCYKEAVEYENRSDIAFLPVEGQYTMDADEAIKLAVKLKPNTVVPYHYGKPFFDVDVDLKGFKNELEDRNIRCELLDPEFKKKD